MSIILILFFSFIQTAPLIEEVSEPAQQSSNHADAMGELAGKDATKRCSSESELKDGEGVVVKRRNNRQIKKPQRFLNAVENV